MFSNKSLPTEAGYIGDELIHDQHLSDLERKCLIIKRTLQDGDFTLDEALSLYEVSKTEFESFIAKKIIGELNFNPSQMQSSKTQALFTIEVLASIYKDLFSAVDKRSMYILQHFQNLSREIEEDKVVL